LVFFPWVDADNVQFPLTSPPTHAVRRECNSFLRIRACNFSCSVFAAGAPQLRAQQIPLRKIRRTRPKRRFRNARASKMRPASITVYTNEDYAAENSYAGRSNSRDRTKQKPQPRLTTKPDAEPLDANSGKPPEPLGDVDGVTGICDAKRDPSPFHLPANQPELAAPKCSRRFLRSRQIHSRGRNLRQNFVLVNLPRRRIALRRFGPCCRRFPLRVWIRFRADGSQFPPAVMIVE